MSILKVDYLVTIFFQNSYSLVPKIKVCLKYFLDKNSQKQPLWQPRISPQTPIFRYSRSIFIVNEVHLIALPWHLHDVADLTWNLS